MAGQKRRSHQLLFNVTAEEGVGLPLGSCGSVGCVDEKAADNFFVEGGGFQVDGLVGVVGWGVISLCEPVFEELLFGRAWCVENVHDDGGNAVADEVVLIAADEEIAERFRVGYRFHAERFCNGGGV